MLKLNDKQRMSFMSNKVSMLFPINTSSGNTRVFISEITVWPNF